MSDDDVPRDTPPTPPTGSPDTRRTLDVSDWLTLDEAATAIGVSTRTVERLAKAGKIEQRLRPQARGQTVAVYYPGDVADRATERRPAPAPFVLAAGPANGNGQPGIRNMPAGDMAYRPADDDPIRQLFAAALRAVLAPTQAPTVPTVSDQVSAKTFLTIREASLATGLTQAYLRRAIENLTLPAIRDVGWRIRRKDLEQL